MGQTGLNRATTGAYSLDEQLRGRRRGSYHRRGHYGGHFQVRGLAYQPLIGAPIRPMGRQDTNLHLSKGSHGMLGRQVTPGTLALQDAMESQVRLELERLKECLAKIR